MTSNKGLFIHVHKCAGTSVRRALFHYQGQERSPPVLALDHSSLPTMRRARYVKCRYQIPDWRERFKFAFVRNPFDRMVSAYLWFKHRQPERRLSYEFPGNFEAFVKLATNARLPRDKAAQSNTFAPRVSIKVHTAPFGANLYYLHAADFIGRYETFVQDLRVVFDRLDLPLDRVPHVGASKRQEKRHYSHYYSRKTRRKVEQYYWDDLERFNYTFEEAA